MEKASPALGSDSVTEVLQPQVEELQSHEDVAKRILDIVIAAASLVILLPFLPLVALLVKFDSPGPVLHRRRVLGRGKIPFDAFKFRTMVTDGDAVLAAHPELHAQLLQDGKLKDDPRVTRIGHWLRRFSVDELPQLLNVLRGEMSMIGPRMISPAELAQFGPYGDEMLSLRPGITGLWQVSGRADLSYEQRVLLNIRYVRTRNFWMDIKILLLTLPVVFFGKGAYYMLIARAPVRVSFFGGGTDLPAYYSEFGGAVLSVTIDKYVYAILSVNQGRPLQITSSDYRTFYRHPRGEPLLWEGDLSLPRAVFQHLGVEDGVSVFLSSEVPPGTGLGSSSSVTVALAKAITVACGLHLTPTEIAGLACEIELGRLHMPIGVQDQYAAACGGFNWIAFDKRGVRVEPLAIPLPIVARLESNLLLIFTGSARNSADILSRQRQSSEVRDPAVIEALHAVHELAARGRAFLLRGELDAFGCLLDEAWQQKKRFAKGISNDQVDQLYAAARNNGALGGKLAGAGGGGFLMLYCEDGTATRVEAALRAAGDYRRMEYGFEYDGARVLFNAGLRLPLSGKESETWQTIRRSLR